MIQIGRQYCYKLIRYFNKYKDLISKSIHKRKIVSTTIEYDSIKNIELDINELKNLEAIKINESSCRESLADIKININNLYYKISHEILKLPNILSEDSELEDRVLDKYTQNNRKYCGSISFTDYLAKYTIRSNGRVVFMDNKLSMLFNKLYNFLVYFNVSNGFNLINGNDIAEDTYMYIAGQLPNLRPFLYEIDNNTFCSPTGEVALIEYTVKNWDSIVLQLKNTNCIKYCTYTSCYRNEDSNCSSFNKPLIRQSVFHKVESFAICNINNETETLDFMLNNAISILDKLNINYRVLRVGSIEMSKSAYIQYDIEIFLPITNKYVEISSCSSCHVFQLNRDNLNTDKEYQDLYCTLNCSALPIERMLAALIEYYWDEDKKEFIIEF